MLQGAPTAGAASAAHHFVGDHQNIMFAAYGLDGLRVSLGRRHDAAGCTDDGLENEGCDALRPQGRDGALELRREMRHKISGSHALRRAIGVRRRDEGDIEQTALEGTAPLCEVRHRQCPQRIAVP